MEAAKQSCVLEFGSLAAACRAANTSALFNNYEKAMKRLNNVWKRFAERKFREEREAGIREATAAARPSTTGFHKDSSSVVAQSIADTGDDGAGRSTFLPVLRDERVTEIEGLDLEQPTGIEEDESTDAFIASRVEDFGRLTAEQTERLASCLPDNVGDEAHQDHDGDGNDVPPSNEQLDEDMQVASTEQYRGHRIFRLELNAMLGRVGRSSTHLSFFSPKYITMQDIYKSVTLDGEISAENVMKLLLDLLSSESHINQLPPHWKSPPGTFYCIFCKAPLEWNKAYSHVLKYCRKASKERAEAKWVTYLASLPAAKCSWTTVVGSKIKPCDHDLAQDTPEERQKHIYKHFKSRNNDKCYWDGCRERFSDQTARFDHARTSHGLLISTALICLYVWCRYCKDYVWEPQYSSDRLAHFAGHLDGAVEMVKDYGYAGVHLGQERGGIIPQEFVPRQCTFCLSDTRLNVEDRLAVNVLTHKSL